MSGDERIVVCGATGTVGREVVRVLLSQNVKVVATTRDVIAARELLGASVQTVHFDYESPQYPGEAFNNADALFLLTPLVDDQVRATQGVLFLAKQAGIQHIVQLSARAVSWDETSRLRLCQRESEKMVRQQTASWCILRPCSFMQNFANGFAEPIRKFSAIIAPQGDGLVPYIDAADVGEIAAQCLLQPQNHAGKIHTLTGARSYGLKGIAAEIGRVIGRPITYIDVDPEQMRENLAQSGLSDQVIEAALAVFAHAKAGKEAVVEPTSSQILGRPAGSLSAFVQRYACSW